jgi:hypothetical protein
MSTRGNPNASHADLGFVGHTMKKDSTTGVAEK